MAREARYDTYDLALERPEPLVPRPLRFEIKERILADGTVLEALDEEAVKRLCTELQRLGIESVAVVFLHAYAHPQHERRAAEILRAVPGLDVSLSSEVAPEWREYERSSTTAANAFVRPLVRGYLGRLESGFAEQGAPDRLHIMMSHGGVTSPDIAGDFAVQLTESGPVGGVMAAAFFGKRIGVGDLIAFDMGGTTSKIGVIDRGVPHMVTEFEVARVARFKRGSGLPLKIPTVELIEIGAGGGSIGHRDVLGLLKVGPLSAGAVPGPACYGKGTEPTVTDANLHLGLLNPDYFLGGKMKLYPERAQDALQTLGDRLGLSATACARGIYDVVNQQMALAMRTHVVERGYDPRRFTLVATGGAGPGHAYEVARHVGIRRILAPPGAGVASALGFLVAPFSVELVRTFPMRLGSIDWKLVAERYAEMERQATELLKRARADLDRAVFERRVDMRYVGQGYEVGASLPGGALSQAVEGELLARFEEAYRRRYGTFLRQTPAEALHWRLTARVHLEDTALEFPASIGGDARKGVRSAFLPEFKGYQECDVYDRYRLAPGWRARGPLLIEERESTIVVGPSAEAQADAFGNVIVTLDETSKG